MEKCIEFGKSQNLPKLYVEAQEPVVNFYIKLGFIPISDVVIIEDYPHKLMEYYFN